ncbi:MAG TPA: imidazole glycerol phosphate synthase subunit HisH, partial [Syntrophales bacterium]|nr:imidazole glycerol phosphate synthase subunit HisH [Syntrophales bacterium]
ERFEFEGWMIAIVDYRAGNLTSVARALQSLKVPCVITDRADELRRAERVIFPGVGAAGEAMRNLRESGLDGCIREISRSGKPLLGICLGTQVIFDTSEEDDMTTCLGIIAGGVKRFPEGLTEKGDLLKIPHMGWNRVQCRGSHPLFAGIPANAEFYFVHSYYPAPANGSDILGETKYGIRFASAVSRGSLVAVQFHPEKSGRFGLRILENFSRWDGSHAQ